jgi:Protein of unknown function (DUF3467)
MSEEAEGKGEVRVTHSAEFKDLVHVRSEQFVSLYCNYAQCSFTPWDIRITFSDVGEAEINNPAYIDLATVTLPPVVAKALITVLQRNVQLYEGDFGEIRVPGKAKEKEQAEGEPAGAETASPEQPTE